MKKTAIRSRATLQKINQFGTAHAADFLPASQGAINFALVAAAVPKVNTVAAQQVSSAETSVSGTDLKAIFFGHLHDDLIAISRTARTIAMTTPGFAAQFHLPHNLTYGNVPNIARAFATDAAPLSAQFVALELPADFIQHLNDDLAAFEGAGGTQQSGDQTRSGATAGIGQNLKPALDAARALDTIVRNKYASNPALLAEWTIASHTERAPRPAKAAPASTTPAKP
jgi:hypothetical protein